MGERGICRSQRLACLCLACAARQGIDREARLFGRRPRGHDGLRRLFDGLACDELALDQFLATREFALGLGQLRAGLAQSRLGFGQVGFADCRKRGAGLIPARFEILRAQQNEHIAGRHPIAFDHAALEHEPGDLGANLHTRRIRHASGGNHVLHERAGLHFVSGQHRPAHSRHAPCREQRQGEHGQHEPALPVLV